MDIQLAGAHRIPNGVFDYPLPVIRVLYEAEQPVVYLTRTHQGAPMLAYVASEVPDYQFILVAPITATSVRMLEAGDIGMREALTASWMWLVRLNFVTESIEVWSVAEHDIPADHLPRAGTPLLPESRTASEGE